MKHHSIDLYDFLVSPTFVRYGACFGMTPDYPAIILAMLVLTLVGLAIGWAIFGEDLLR